MKRITPPLTPEALWWNSSRARLDVGHVGLRDIPRTATVVARSDAQLLALERDDFIATVTGFAPSAEAADSVIAARLGSQRRSEAAV